MRLLHDDFAALAGQKCTAEVGVPLRQVLRDGVDDLLRYLCAARRVEECGGAAVPFLVQRRELPPHPFHIELAYAQAHSCTCCHAYALLTAFTKSESMP